MLKFNMWNKVGNPPSNNVTSKQHDDAPCAVARMIRYYDSEEVPITDILVVASSELKRLRGRELLEQENKALAFIQGKNSALLKEVAIDVSSDSFLKIVEAVILYLSPGAVLNYEYYQTDPLLSKLFADSLKPAKNSFLEELKQLCLDESPLKNPAYMSLRRNAERREWVEEKDPVKAAMPNASRLGVLSFQSELANTVISDKMAARFAFTGRRLQLESESSENTALKKDISTVPLIEL